MNKGQKTRVVKKDGKYTAYISGKKWAKFELPYIPEDSYDLQQLVVSTLLEFETDDKLKSLRCASEIGDLVVQYENNN